MEYERIRLIREALGSSASEMSKDGKAGNLNGSFAEGVPAKLTFRRSKSAGLAWDLKVDDVKIRHIDGNKGW